MVVQALDEVLPSGVVGMSFAGQDDLERVALRDVA